MLQDPAEFSNLIVAWYYQHGRKDLPWQQNPTPYRVWISEIMLQQTQVATVIPYYERFMQRFPELSDLAEGSQDEVLHYWSGLGYYARARNLHRAAQLITQDHAGQLPATLDELTALPGVGRSTAGAILSLALNHSQPILDGNVKRVLARCFAVPGWSGVPKVQKRLWILTESLTLLSETRAYNQAMMDIGATICLRTKPRCDHCPVQACCKAYQQGDATAYPEPRPRKRLPTRSLVMLLVYDAHNQVLLEARSERGIWGGLWGLPEFSGREAAEAAVSAWFGDRHRGLIGWDEHRHTFSHFHLLITPLVVELTQPATSIMDGNNRVWYNTDKPDKRGLAAPVSRLINALKETMKERCNEPYGGMRKTE